MKSWLRNRNDQSARVNIFSELLLTVKFRHYLRMYTTSYVDFDYLYIDYLYTHTYITYTMITYTSCITCTYNYTACSGVNLQGKDAL